MNGLIREKYTMVSQSLEKLKKQSNEKYHSGPNRFLRGL